MNSRLRLTLVTLLASMLTLPTLADTNPKAALEAVRELRSARKLPQAQEKAKESIKDVDPAKVDMADAQEWCELYTAAADFQGLKKVATRWVDAAKSDEKFKAQTALLNAQAKTKDADGLIATLESVKPSSPAESLRAASMANSYVTVPLEAKEKDKALKLLDLGEKFIPKNDSGTEAGVKRVTEQLAATRKAINENPGKELEAVQSARLEALKAAMARQSTSKTKPTTPGAKVDKEVEFKAREEADAKRFEKLIGQEAPEIKFTKAIGEFKSLKDLKGKVVVLDFFAHWCGPCKKGLPSLVDLYKELKPEGLEVVSVTRFYGYYDKENREKKDMPEATEYERMKDFVKEYKMDWPVVFTGSDVFKSFQVSGIPQVVVIDKTGKVHRVKVGFYPDEVEHFHKQIKALLKG